MRAKVRLPDRQRRMEAMDIWRLRIDSMTGKAGS
jgi:hypothetical protein